MAGPRVRPFPLAELPRLVRAQVDAGRALLRHLPLQAGPDFAEACRALGGPVEIALVETYALPARELRPRLRGAVVKLDAPGGRFALLVIDERLAPRLARKVLGTGEPELAAPRPLTVAEAGALELLVTTLAGGPPLEVAGVLDEAERERLAAALPPEGWVYALEARVDTPVGSGFARVLAPESIRLAAPPAQPEARYARRGRLDDARVDLCIEVGRTALTRAELTSLEPGDVVLLDRVRVRDARGGPVTLRLGRGGFPARLDGEALRIEGPYRLGAKTMDDENTKHAGADALLGELPVEAVCELGRVTMTGRELLELRPGAVIPVGRPLAGPVDVTVGGRVVARGELVDVEGEIGVRVTQLLD